MLMGCQVTNNPGEIPPIEVTKEAFTKTVPPTQTNTPTAEPHATEAWQSEVDALRALTRSMTIPDNLLDEDATPDEDLFDPNLLLQPLGHLQLIPGYQLDFVYYYDGNAGMPYLYARQINTPALESYEAYLDACDQADAVILCNHKDAILTDGTEASYFQWILLHTMGEQFYLLWHANYNDREIIASNEALIKMVERYANISHGAVLTDQQISEALAIDPAPIVEIQNSTVSVSVISFTEWGGFYRTNYIISSDAPHYFMEIETENLVPYDIGIVF